MWHNYLIMKHGEIVEEIARRIPHNPDARFLDVGCGSGWMIDELIKLTSADGYGIDPFASYHNRCRPLAAEEMDRIKIDFDVIYTVHSFHHFEDPQAFLMFSAKLLKPQGKLIIVDWKKGVDTGVPERYYSPDEVKSMLTNWFDVTEDFEIERSFFIVAVPKTTS